MGPTPGNPEREPSLRLLLQRHVLSVVRRAVNHGSREVALWLLLVIFVPIGLVVLFTGLAVAIVVAWLVTALVGPVEGDVAVWLGLAALFLACLPVLIVFRAIYRWVFLSDLGPEPSPAAMPVGTTEARRRPSGRRSPSLAELDRRLGRGTSSPSTRATPRRRRRG